MNKRRKLEIEKIADDTRALSKVSTISINDIFDVCTALGIYYLRYPLDNDSVLGSTIKKGSKYIIFSNSSAIQSREIFTVAHELGHIQLSHLLDDSDSLSDYNLFGDNEKEIEANYFAANLLMPELFVMDFFKGKSSKDISFFDIVRFQSTFNVSFDAAVNRINSLNILSDADANNLKTKKSSSNIRIGDILKAIGNDAQLCSPSNSKAISIEYFEWLKFNYSKGVISEETLEKAIGYFDVPFISLGIEKIKDDTDAFDSFWED